RRGRAFLIRIERGLPGEAESPAAGAVAGAGRGGSGGGGGAPASQLRSGGDAARERGVRGPDRPDRRDLADDGLPIPARGAAPAETAQRPRPAARARTVRALPSQAV